MKYDILKENSLDIYFNTLFAHSLFHQFIQLPDLL
jgi:hypothetical protein